MHELGGQDLQAGLLETGDDLPGDVLGHGVGLDDGERALYGHGLVHCPFSRTSFYSALASPGPCLRHGPVSARNSTQHSPHRALPYVSAPFRLEIHLPTTFATVAPMSAGLLTVVMPANSMAFIFSAAVPLPPAMMAPAWPMRRPGGAVWPQMKPTTGFLTWALMKAAASSSAVPPISPIIMMARVAASSLKSRSTSTNELPLTGSPPMPTHVDWPMLRAL